MDTNQKAVENFHSRALARVRRVDRIFLCRGLFVMLAMVLGATGLVFAQRPAGKQRETNLNSREPNVVSARANVSREKTVVGETKPLGNGVARSWVSLDRNGNPTAVGLTFSEEALSTLPKEPPPGAEGTEVSFALPAQASATAFRHVGLNWNPHGHPPEKIYDVAHLDFHFYMITEEERAAITATGESLAKSQKHPTAEFVPAGYIYEPNSIIPRMGAHWINPLSKELQGQTFTTTFIYGSHDGRLIFAEPMITRAFLETKTNWTEFVPLPEKYARRAYYPTKYSIRYDAATKEYTVALEGMTLR